MAKIAATGGGIIGQSWATVFAQFGYEVSMYDPAPAVSEQALKSIETRIGDLVEFNLTDSSQAQAMLPRISFTDNLKNALDNVIYVQECVPEHIDIKHELTRQLDELLPAENTDRQFY